MTDYFINNKLTGWIIILLSLGFGVTAYLNSARFEDPEFTIRTAQIVTLYPGATAQQVADEISDEIETRLQSMPEVLEVRSTSYPGLSIVSVDVRNEFTPDRQSVRFVWNRVRNSVSDAQRNFPPGAGTPMVNDDFGDVFGLYYMVTGEGFTLKEIFDYVEELKKQLLAVPGVAKVDVIGEQEEVINIEISRGRVAALGLNLNSIYNALTKQNMIVSAGNVKIGDLRIGIQPTTDLDAIEEVENLVIGLNGGADIVVLKDIATVSRSTVEPATRLVRFDGQDAIAFGVSALPGSNIAEIGRSVEQVLNQTLDSRPVGMEIHEFYHQGKIVDASVSDFALNVLLAIVIVLITLWIFMGVRAAIVIGSVLVITIAATLATMYLVGIPLHRISLGALIIALGMLVDNAIVVVDGILVGLKRKQSILDSAKTIIKQTKWPLFGGTLVGIIAFAPIGLAPGNVAEYTNHLFWVIFISLSFSWFFALSITPMLVSLVMKETDQSDSSEVVETKAFRLLKRFLRATLSFRWLIVLFSFSCLCVAIWGFQFVKVGFFPTSTAPQIVIDYWLPEGSDISATSRDVKSIEQYIDQQEGIVAMHTVIGGPALRYMLIYAPEMPSGSFGQIILKVKPDYVEQIDPMMATFQQYIDDNFPSAQARVWRFRLGPSQGARIEASFSGPDPQVLRDLSQQALEIFRSNPKAVAVKTDWRNQIPFYEPEYDPNRGGRSGVSREDFIRSINKNITGETIGLFRDGRDILRIISKAPLDERSDLMTLANAPIPSSISGRTVSISESLARLDLSWRDGRMLREDRVWTIKVQADPERGVLTDELFAEIRPLVEQIALPQGYKLKWDGEYGASKEANGELALTLPLGVLTMVLVVIFMFNALKQAAIIWLTVPLSIVGVVIGFLSTGTTMEFMAILGILSLSGLLIKNALVLVEQLDTQIAQGQARFDAVIDATASRVRPVMLGSMTTVLGVLPLLSDVFFASMSVVLVFGLTCATLLTLLVIPALYSVFFRIKTSEVSQ